jgi:hypothetical protein
LKSSRKPGVQAEPEVTLTVSVSAAVPPLPSDTVTLTAYVPATSNVWAGAADVAFPPSPKSQA